MLDENEIPYFDDVVDVDEMRVVVVVVVVVVVSSSDDVVMNLRADAARTRLAHFPKIVLSWRKECRMDRFRTMD